MSAIDHFAYGLLTPVVAYIMSSVGSMLGLLLTSRARLVGAKEGRWWLAGAAIAIGGTGIWTMHFIAMMGFAVPGTTIDPRHAQRRPAQPGAGLRGGDGPLLRPDGPGAGPGRALPG